MSELGRRSQRFVDAARAAPGMSDEQRARARARILARVGAGAALTQKAAEAALAPKASAALRSAVTPAVTSHGAGVAAKALVMLAVLAGAGAGVRVALRDARPAVTAAESASTGAPPGSLSPERPSAPVALDPPGQASAGPPASPEDAPAAPARVSTPVSGRAAGPVVAGAARDAPPPSPRAADGRSAGGTPTPEPPRAEAPSRGDGAGEASSVGGGRPAANAGASPPSSVGAPPVDTLADDVRLLREVQGALQAGDAPRALRLLDERDARGGAGSLAEERQAARLLAQCKAGRSSAARTAAALFVTSHPRSPLVAHLRSACGVEE